MAGNVWEWCLNKYDNPKGRSVTKIDKSVGQRVLRGGSWGDRPGTLRSSIRYRFDAVNHFNDIGFRLAQDIS
jgi:formylglycine-generating enzyme required for sulfatase activity